MATKKPKFYVVWKGRMPGIYDSWEKCKEQVLHYEDARYKSFESRAAAQKALEEGTPAYKPVSGRPTASKTIKTNVDAIVRQSIAVDAACSGNPGIMEYRGVVTGTGEELFRMGPFKDGTNNVGEFLALVHGLAMLKKQHKDDVLIYSDSRIAIGWVKNKKSKSTLKRTGKNDYLFELIDRAENWLQTNHFKNPIVKWETKHWGEIPADFGRK